jgi:hypothetical protein
VLPCCAVLCRQGKVTDAMLATPKPLFILTGELAWTIVQASEASSINTLFSDHVQSASSFPQSLLTGGCTSMTVFALWLE